MVGALTLLFVAILFALQNTQPIRVNLLFVSTEGSAALVLVCTFILGVLVGVLGMIPARLRDRRRLKQLQSEQKSQGDTSASGSPQRSDASSNAPDARS